MECNKICKWNSNVGCVKPFGVPCILENVSQTDKKATNADRIRAMSDEELAQEMIFFCPSDTVFKGAGTYEKPHYTGLDGRYYSTSEELVAANLEWLQQSAEGG